MKDNGKYYEIEDLYDDQKFAVETVLKKLREWVETPDLAEFQPLRLTINGSGGCGKSVIINTLVTAIRRMFDRNDVVQVAAPTGTAAFNVGGKTLHSLMHMGVDKFDYKPKSLRDVSRARLVNDFKSLLALIIDERSLISSKDLGTVETMMSETIYRGGLLNRLSFGGLPVLVLVGDDYQLPSTSSGAIDIIGATGGSKMVLNGRDVFLDCAKHVIELTASKRLADDRMQDREIIRKVRVREDLQDFEVKKLLSLHTDNIISVHGKDVMDSIASTAMYLFFRNAPRIRHNLERLSTIHSSEKPAGFFRCQGTGVVGGKPIRSHFNSDPPPTAIFCEDAQVAVDGRNFYPEWGIHNSACGRVDEIVFKKDENPNFGDLPEYVVVDFPGYCGPVWDENNPTVRTRTVWSQTSYSENRITTNATIYLFVIRSNTSTACSHPNCHLVLFERNELL